MISNFVAFIIINLMIANVSLSITDENLDSLERPKRFFSSSNVATCEKQCSKNGSLTFIDSHYNSPLFYLFFNFNRNSCAKTKYDTRRKWVWFISYAL